jgi:sensor domain CHASE-containing protein
MQTAMPDIIKIFVEAKDIPHFMSDNVAGHRFWGAIISVIKLIELIKYSS